MRNLVDSPEFGLADLACAVIASAWWTMIHQANAWPLIIGLIPWAFRLAAGKFPVRRTPLDIPMMVFLLTAGTGVWAAYDRAAAWNKFWLIVAAILLYYALAGQPPSNSTIIVGLAGMLGAGLSIYFLLTNNWNIFPADISILNRLGTVWMKVRPGVHAPIIQLNIAGGLLAMLLPVSLAWVIYIWMKHSWMWLLVAVGSIVIISIGLLMTSSRAAWAALIVALGLWLWWEVSESVARKIRRSRRLTFSLPIMLVILMALGLLGLHRDSFFRMANALPGKADAGSRAEIIRNTIQLIRDYPFTGGGLASFPGLYSTYIRIIQVPEFFYSHNLYTDVGLEQGLPGLAALWIIMAGTGWLLLKSLVASPSRNLLAGGCLAGLMVILLHGFLDDALYGMGGTPLLFILPGIAANLQLTNYREAQIPEKRTHSLRMLISTSYGWLLGSTLVILGLGGMCLALAKPLMSAWQANMGAVAMSRIYFFVWPDPLTETKTAKLKIDPIISLFNKALEQNPKNPTALYRLGILAYQGNDFAKASNFLQSAYRQNRDHRGIQKLLGYTYTWTGEILKAKALLIHISEAGYEMTVYSWWWGTQNRADLAGLASQMADQLQKP